MAVSCHPLPSSSRPHHSATPQHSAGLQAPTSHHHPLLSDWPHPVASHRHPYQALSHHLAPYLEAYLGELGRHRPLVRHQAPYHQAPCCRQAPCRPSLPACCPSSPGACLRGGCLRGGCLLALCRQVPCLLGLGLLVLFRSAPCLLVPFRLVPFRLVSFRLVPFRRVPFRRVHSHQAPCLQASSPEGLTVWLGRTSLVVCRLISCANPSHAEVSRADRSHAEPRRADRSKDGSSVAAARVAAAGEQRLESSGRRAVAGARVAVHQWLCLWLCLWLCR